MIENVGKILGSFRAQQFQKQDIDKFYNLSTSEGANDPEISTENIGHSFFQSRLNFQTLKKVVPKTFEKGLLSNCDSQDFQSFTI